MISQYCYTFSKDNTPVARAKPGETLSFATPDCFTGEIRSENDLTSNFDYNHANPATGPVYIEGAEAGDLLTVYIKSIKISETGVMTTLPGVGPLQDRMELRTRIFPIKNGHVSFYGLELPVKPMIGVIGVAPAGDPVGCGFPGSHGGNLDSKLMGAGARLYLPVRTTGALFQVGDLHALMGDGELCGTGLEVSGEVELTFGLIKKTPLDWPLLETETAWHIMTSDLDYTTALIAATRQTQSLLTAVYGWDVTDVFFYLSLEGDLHVNQGCQPCPVPIVLRLSVPKRKGKELVKG
jgi:amidase